MMAWTSLNFTSKPDGFSKATPDCGFGCENSGMLVSGSSPDYAPEGEKKFSLFSTKGFWPLMHVNQRLSFLAVMVCVIFFFSHKDTTRRTRPSGVLTAFRPCRVQKGKVNMLFAEILPSLRDAKSSNDANQKRWQDGSEKFTWGHEGIAWFHLQR